MQTHLTATFSTAKKTEPRSKHSGLRRLPLGKEASGISNGEEVGVWRSDGYRKEFHRDRSRTDLRQGHGTTQLSSCWSRLVISSSHYVSTSVLSSSLPSTTSPSSVFASSSVQSRTTSTTLSFQTREPPPGLASGWPWVPRRSGTQYTRASPPPCLSLKPLLEPLDRMRFRLLRLGQARC